MIHFFVSVTIRIILEKKIVSLETNDEVVYKISKEMVLLKYLRIERRCMASQRPLVKTF